MNTQEPLTYADVQELAKASPLKVIANRIEAVRSYYGSEVFSQNEDDFYSVLKKYFDIQTRGILTQDEVDFCNEVIRVMDIADAKSSSAVGEMVDRLKKELDGLLGLSETQ